MTNDAKQEREAVLLPCPFCGNPPKSGDSTYGYWLIFCSDENNCLAQPSVELKTEAEAIAAWNTRAQTDATIEAQAAEIERLRDALEYYAQELMTGPWGIDSLDFGDVARAALEQSK
jgi:hypothetical protein